MSEEVADMAWNADTISICMSQFDSQFLFSQVCLRGGSVRFPLNTMRLRRCSGELGGVAPQLQLLMHINLPSGAHFRNEARSLNKERS